MGSRSPGLVVLMADDDEDDCFLVESAFREIGIDHDLRFVANGLELLDYLYNEGDFRDHEKYPKPDLILLDLNMPMMDGRQALKAIKADPRLWDIPILIFTTSREELDIELTRREGASSFLTKPEVFEDLADVLSKFCTAIRNDPNVPFRVIGC
ncbi:MAG: response regulator [Syntrophobacteraceae bacterium]